MIFVYNYQYVVKLWVLFNIPWTKELWHGFTMSRLHGIEIIFRITTKMGKQDVGIRLSNNLYKGQQECGNYLFKFLCMMNVWCVV